MDAGTLATAAWALRTRRSAAPVVAVAVAATLGLVSLPVTAAQEQVRGPCAIESSGAAEFGAVKLYIEYNATDGDVGVHGSIDSDGWSDLCVSTPDGRPILVVDPRNQLRDLAIGAFFFESREPPLGEFSIEDLRERFPEGAYPVRARAHDGSTLAGSARFTHAIPSPPTIVTPVLAEDDEAAHEARVADADLLVTWEPVTATVDGNDLRVTGYEVIVTKVGADDPHGFSTPILDVHVPSSLTSIEVTADFLEPSTTYELEVLALEGSGNQTITVGFFMTD